MDLMGWGLTFHVTKMGKVGFSSHSSSGRWRVGSDWPPGPQGSLALVCWVQGMETQRLIFQCADLCPPPPPPDPSCCSSFQKANLTSLPAASLAPSSVHRSRSPPPLVLFSHLSPCACTPRAPALVSLPRLCCCFLCVELLPGSRVGLAALAGTPVVFPQRTDFWFLCLAASLVCSVSSARGLVLGV